MKTIMICSHHDCQQSQIELYLQDYCQQKNINFSIEWCDSFEEFRVNFMEKNIDILMIAWDGTEGLDAVSSVKTLGTQMIWISDLDFGVQSYKLGVTYFCQKPLTFSLFKLALDSCFLE